MDSTPNLSEPDLDDFSLGSLETNNIINNHLDNYLSSLTTFPNFSSHIPSSVVGTSIHSTQFTINPLQALPTMKNSIQKKLRETKTPRTVSFAANVTPVSAATDSNSIHGINPSFFDFFSWQCCQPFQAYHTMHLLPIQTSPTNTPFFSVISPTLMKILTQTSMMHINFKHLHLLCQHHQF